MYCGYITTIKIIRKHSNADRLQVVTVFGNDVIVDLTYHVGQKVVFFPTDGQLNEEFALANNLVRIKDENGNNIGGYMDPEKRHVTAIKLRGEKSEGLILPADRLAPYTDVDKLNDGDQISKLGDVLICQKYIPKRQHRTSTKPMHTRTNKKELLETVRYDFFKEHIDTQQLAFCQRAFKPGDTIYLTLKMHGTSARTGYMIETTTKKRNKILRTVFHLKDKVSTKYAYVSGTRRTVLRNYEGGYYGSNAFRQQYHDFFKEKLPKGMEVFYEIVGWVDEDRPIMGRCKNSLVKDKEFSKQYGNETIFSYGCEPGQSDIYVYRMTMTNEDGFAVELPWEQVQIECEKMGVKCVPTFEKFIFTTWEDLMERVEKYYEGPDPVGVTHIREGIVARIDNRPSFTAYKHKGIYFKILEGIVKDTSDAPDMEEAEDLIVEEVEDRVNYLAYKEIT